MGTPRSGRRRLLVLVAVAAALAAATVVVIRYGLPYKRHREVERRLEVYRGDPSRENSGPLVQMLTTEQLTAEDGQEILKTFLSLQAAVQPAYHSGDPVVITIFSDHLGTLEYPPQMRGIGRRLFIEEMHTFLWFPAMDPPREYTDSQAVQIDLDLLFRVFNAWWPSGAPASAGKSAVVFREPGDYAGSVEIRFKGRTHGFTPPPPPGRLDKVLDYLGLKDRTGDGEPHYDFATEIPVLIHVE